MNSACFGGSKTGTATGVNDGSSAAAALTKGVSFNDGNLVLGALPESTLTDLTLAPASGGTVLPGDTALMSLDVDNPDDSDPVDFTLLQFEGAADHFEVKNTSVATDAGIPGDASARPNPGGAADVGPKQQHAPTKLKLSYKVDPDVCTTLCDTKFTLNVTQAVKLKKGGVSSRAKTTVQLDCTTKGNHRLCPSGTKPVSGQTAGAKLITAFAALNSSLCGCNAQSSGICGLTADQATCMTTVFDSHAAELTSQMPCMQSYLDTQQTCIDNAKCVSSALAKCDFAVWAKSASTGPGGNPFQAACGALPQDVQSGADACGGGTDAGVSSVVDFVCTSGEHVTKAQLCDGKQDCKDNGDEGTTICTMCANGVGTYSVAAACDGQNDCADGTDESSTTCTLCTNGVGKYPATAHCDGNQDCADGSDELNCPAKG